MTILVGDCVELMAAMPDASVDVVVTDPPYGIRFMGNAWDGAAIERDAQRARGTRAQRPKSTPTRPNRNVPASSAYGEAQEAGAYDFSLKGNHAFQSWCQAWATEALRVLKPGGHLLAFGGTRTYHRLACAVEDAGFEIRDTLCWLYGSGFPKSHNLAAFSLVATRQTFDGWGTALKPAHEPIVVARKPLGGTVAANVLEHGTGALNVDGCRIEGPKGDGNWKGATEERGYDGGWDSTAKPNVEQNALGRWPANVVLDEDAAAMLDEQTGELTSGANPTRRGSDKFRLAYGDFEGQRECDPARGADSGGASRFFYVAKASRAERNAGLEGFEATFSPTMGNGIGGKEHDPDTATAKRNTHPTVKPVALMRWLVRLVTPPGGLVLDPFAGSGTTGIACALEGFEFTGCEQDANYAKIAEARIAWWSEHGEEALAIVRAEEKAEAAREQVAESGQLDIFEAL